MKITLIVVGVVAGLELLHRFCIALEDAGYLYYRKGGGGGGGIPGALSELDKLAIIKITGVLQSNTKPVQ